MKYRTIVADPPWHYDQRVVGTPEHGTESAPFPYPTMSIAQLVLLPIEDLADEDAVLWLWSTNRWLPDALGLVDVWGFTYKQTLVWGKNNPMPVGSVAPSAAEFLIAGKRGKPRMNWTWPSSVLMLPRPMPRRHSAKPEAFMDHIEASSPGPYLELFARRNRLGWDTWGNESLEHVALGGEA